MSLDESTLQYLLGSIAASDEDPEAAVALADYLYPALFVLLKNRRVTGSAGWLAATGTDAVAYIPEADRGQIAHDATALTIERLTKSAGRYDPALGSAKSWVFRASLFAFREVVADTYEWKRKLKSEPVADDQLDRLLDRQNPTRDPTDSYVRRLDLISAIERLPDDERTALLMHHRYGYTYREISVFIFGEESQLRVVEGLLARARTRIMRIVGEGV